MLLTTNAASCALAKATSCDIGAYEYISNLTVTTTRDEPNDDDGVCNSDCSLREALAMANVDGKSSLDRVDDVTIGFSSGLADDVILGSPLPQILRTLTINGQGATVSGDDLYRVFEVGQGGNLTIDTLTIAHGKAIQGGGIYNSGKVNLTNSTISGNRATTANGGGISTVAQRPWSTVPSAGIRQGTSAAASSIALAQ